MASVGLVVGSPCAVTAHVAGDSFLGFFSHPDFAHRGFARRHIEHDGNFAISRHRDGERIIADNALGAAGRRHQRTRIAHRYADATRNPPLGARNGRPSQSENRDERPRYRRQTAWPCRLQGPSPARQSIGQSALPASSTTAPCRSDTMAAAVSFDTEPPCSLSIYISASITPCDAKSFEIGVNEAVGNFFRGWS